mgnify:CR=1 FL=1|jgi:hypothetical protein
MANINVRAKDATIDRLKEIASCTGESQADVIAKALEILDDFMLCKKEMSIEEQEKLPLAMKLIIKKI